MKNIRELFGHAVQRYSTLEDLMVEEVKFSKRQNAAIISLIVDRKINPIDIFELENRAVEIFTLKSFKVMPKLKNINIDVTEKDISNAIDFVAKREDYIAPMLAESRLEINDTNVMIELKTAQSRFLKLKKVDKKIENVISAIYGKTYTVDFVDSKEAREKLTKEMNARPREVKVEYNVKNENINKSYDKDQSENNIKKDIKIPEEKKSNTSKENEAINDVAIIYGNNIINEKTVSIDSLNSNDIKACISGQVIALDSRETKTGKILIMLDIGDKTSAISCKMFSDSKKAEIILSKLKIGKYIKLSGKPQIDTYSNELSIMINSIMECDPPPKKQDNAEEKRVELHMHTQMSSMDGISSAKDLIKQAIAWGHNAVAITDHGVVQAFPEANHVILDNYEGLAKEKTGKAKVSQQDIIDNAPIKVIYGVEGYLVDDIVVNPTFSDTYCVFDLETTGFDPKKQDKITEIAICKVKNGEIIDEYTTFINPERNIPFEVQKLTHITNEMVKDAPTIEEALPDILDFIEGTTLVAHNSDFDITFLSYFIEKEGYKDRFNNLIIDTLMVAKELYYYLPNKKLGTIVEELGIKLEGAHRAINDTRATAKMFVRMAEDLEKKGLDINTYAHSEKNISNIIGEKAYHVIILAKNYIGLKNLYKLVSYSHLHYFKRKPKIFKSMLNRYRDGLIIGSACEQGELYQSILRKDSEEIQETIASYYDYLEVQPLGNNAFYTRGVKLKNRESDKLPDSKEKEYTYITLTEDDLININKRIVEIGEKQNKYVVATCDVHFLNPEDEIYRRILQAGQGYDDADMQAPLYFRTTSEMLQEFNYLSPEKAYEIVVTNTNKVADMCERISPISDEKCPPHIDGCEEEIRKIAMDKANSLYGDPLPEIVQERLDKELNSIISNGYAVMYIIAQRLVWDSNDHGYIVGSRGSVGSSLAAYMTGITEVNSLKAHYRCPECKYSDFSDHGVANGIDLPDKNCPVCGHKLDKDGIDIPFETFLGFNGDKEPDIDLNFSGEYQAEAHKYTEEIFGRGTTYKAGTIGTIADKTAYGYVKNYYAERNIHQREAEINRIAKGCTGTKRTTGQHPGGIVVVPKGREIFEFCPVQHPADDPYSTIKTTHFDYHSIDRNLLKLDILGHDDPTMIRMLYDLTGQDPTKIPLDDKETMSIFSSTKALGVTPEQIGSEVGTYGVPEFGTKFVRGMLVDTRPTTFDELIRISGLSHGTDVWLSNAQELIKAGTVTLQEAICCRDDIMIYLINKGLDPGLSFKIMELVRKGKALKDPVKWAEYEEAMREKGVPEWYINSCKKIKYMFPKAHAAAYVTNAFRIAWFKVHKPEAYYTAFMSIRADEFDSESMLHGKEKVKNKMKEINSLGNRSYTKR